MHSASATPSFGAAFSGSLATLSSIGMGSSALDFPSPFAAYALGGHASGGGGGGGGGRDSPTDGGSFVEVADGRVSRLHAWVKWDGKLQAAVLEVRALRCCCCSIRLLAVCSLLLPLHCSRMNASSRCWVAPTHPLCPSSVCLSSSGPVQQRHVLQRGAGWQGQQPRAGRRRPHQPRAVGCAPG
jgi:hypothetical protein